MLMIEENVPAEATSPFMTYKSPLAMKDFLPIRSVRIQWWNGYAWGLVLALWFYVVLELTRLTAKKHEQSETWLMRSLHPAWQKGWRLMDAGTCMEPSLTSDRRKANGINGCKSIQTAEKVRSMLFLSALPSSLCLFKAFQCVFINLSAETISFDFICSCSARFACKVVTCSSKRCRTAAPGNGDSIKATYYCMVFINHGSGPGQGPLQIDFSLQNDK